MPRVIALAALTALAAVLRFATLDAQSFWFDEAVTVHLLQLDLGEMLERIPDSESTPPLYYLLAWLWSKAFGPGEVGRCRWPTSRHASSARDASALRWRRSPRSARC